MKIKVENIIVTIDDNGVKSKDKALEKQINELILYSDTSTHKGNGYFNTIKKLFKDVEIIEENNLKRRVY